MKSASSAMIFLLAVITPSLLLSQHNPGTDCVHCHPKFKLAGTLFGDSLGKSILPGTPLSLLGPDGSVVTLDPSNKDGNIVSSLVPDGSYIVRLGRLSSRTWHSLPDQRSCNTCHRVGGNGSSTRTKRLPQYHTAVPADNDCRHCHHFPASMSLAQLQTPGVLNNNRQMPATPGSRVIIGSNVYPFAVTDVPIATRRPDIFAPGFFSMFDVILEVARRNNIPIEYHYDDSCKTHFIKKINGVEDDYWYHWSYDGGGNNELRFRRANRWDEALWRPGVWIQVVTGENLEEIRAEYKEEIIREERYGHMIPLVRFSINPSIYRGNPPESDRRTVSREFTDVSVSPHDLRASGTATPHSTPFQPGVVTSMDIPLSLRDRGELTAVTSVFYSYFAGNYIDSYYVVELGFPGVGSAHSSGRQGFVYVTENGAFNRLPNGADGKLHMTSDINVIHAPDFSQWRWIELGNPYYENADPTTGVEENSLLEDYEALSRGFNLHAPYPNPVSGNVTISYNLFEEGEVDLSVWNVNGERIATLVHGAVSDIGVRCLEWNTFGLSPGVYTVVMSFGRHRQERRLLLLR